MQRVGITGRMKDIRAFLFPRDGNRYAESRGYFSDCQAGRVGIAMDLAGNATPQWQVNNFQATWAIPSHTGKYVVIPAPTTECNVWMVENF